MRMCMKTVVRDLAAKASVIGKGSQCIEEVFGGIAVLIKQIWCIDG